jgi:hypothetical protein
VRKNLVHFAEYWHPFASPAAASDSAAASGSASSKSDATAAGTDAAAAATADDSAADGSTSSSLQKKKKRSRDADSQDGDDGDAPADSSSSGKRAKTAVASDADGSDANAMDTSADSASSSSPSKSDGGDYLIKRRYSSLTEAERRQLIESAVSLQSELQRKEKELQRMVELQAQLKAEVDKFNKIGRIPLLPGEAAARSGDKTVIFPLTSQRNHSADDPREIHYRYAESQFLRLGAAVSGLTVTQVDYVVNPRLVRAFESKQEALSKQNGRTEHPLLAFHGTKVSNIEKIIETNFLLAKLSANTGDKGFYGAGIYFR